MKLVASILYVTLFFTTLNGQTVLKDTAELAMRDGLPNFFSKVLSGQPVNVGYFGGSLTEADGWRVKTLDWFREYYSNTGIEAYNGAIGGTNSKFGVFRIEDHLLSKDDFDLIFIEFAVNDLTNRSSEIEKCIEGIVRKIWTKDPSTDICFIYALRDGAMLDTIYNGKLPLTATKHDIVAETYGIPAIFFGVKIVQELESGSTIFTGVVTDPVNDKNSEGKYVFTKDGVHPTNYGHDIYAQIVAKCFKIMDDVHQPNIHSLIPTVFEDNYQFAKMLPYDLLSNHGFTEITSTAEYDFLDAFITMGNNYLLSEDMETYYELEFYGDIAGFSIIRGPHAGKGILAINGDEQEVDFFDAYSDYYRENSFFLSLPLDTHHIMLSPGDHFTIAEKEQILLEDRRLDIQSNPSDYSHNYIIFNKILINGSIINQSVTGNRDYLPEKNSTLSVHHGQLLITMSVEDEGEKLISVYNILGKLVHVQGFTGPSTLIPLKTESGIYLVHILYEKSGISENYKIAF